MPSGAELREAHCAAEDDGLRGSAIPSRDQSSAIKRCGDETIKRIPSTHNTADGLVAKSSRHCDEFTMG